MTLGADTGQALSSDRGGQADERRFTACIAGEAGADSARGQTRDVPNLLISDGSQFPSSGLENPILTIVALAIRQAGSLAEQLSARSM